MRALRSAFSYFTILPTGAAAAPDASAIAWLPLAGIVTGGIAGFAAYGVALVAPFSLAVATAFVLPIVLTGAIHLDGFLDGCDAFFASVSAERRFEILKDPRHGTFALVGLAVTTVVAVAALGALAPVRYPFALPLAAGAARWAAAIHALRVPYRSGGKPPLPILALGALIVLAVALPLGVAGYIALAVALAVGAVTLDAIRRRLDGVLVGDAYGFAIVVAELAVLIVLAASRSFV